MSGPLLPARFNFRALPANLLARDRVLQGTHWRNLSTTAGIRTAEKALRIKVLDLEGLTLGSSFHLGQSSLTRLGLGNQKPFQVPTHLLPHMKHRSDQTRFELTADGNIIVSLAPKRDQIHASQQGGNMNIHVEDNYDSMSIKAAQILIIELQKVLERKGKAALILSSGETPKGLYALLASQYNNAIDWNLVTLYQMDEHEGLAPSDPNSFAYTLNEQVVKPLGIGNVIYLHDESGNLAIDLCSLEEDIRAREGIDIVVHGIGTNGHIGFNEPGTPFDSTSGEVALAESTIRAHTRVFGTYDETPKRGHTLGLGILRESKFNILMASGQRKHSAFTKAAYGEITPSVPASILQTSKTVYIADREAAGQ